MVRDSFVIQDMERDASGWTFTVEAGDGENTNGETTHVVRVDYDYYEQLTEGKVEADVLVEEAFTFLLERESHDNILPSFDLQTINTYFDDFEEVMAERLAEDMD